MFDTKKLSPVFLILILGIAALAAYMYWPVLDPGGWGGGAGIALTINYADGTTENIEPENRPRWVGLFGTALSIQVMDKPISSMDCRVKYKADWTGTVTSYSMSGSLKLYVNNAVKQTWTITKPSTISKGFWKDLLSKTVSESAFSVWVGTDGSHTLRLDSTVTLSMTFSDGSSHTKTASDTVSLTIKRVADAPVGAITLFDVTVYFSPNWK